MLTLGETPLSTKYPLGSIQRNLSADLSLADGESLLVVNYFNANGHTLTVNGDAVLAVIDALPPASRAGTAESSATPAINIDLYDSFELTAQAVNITSMSSGLTGTPYRNQSLLIVITSTGTITITWGASFEDGIIFALPTGITGAATLEMVFRWNAVTSKWRRMA